MEKTCTINKIIAKAWLMWDGQLIQPACFQGCHHHPQLPNQTSTHIQVEMWRNIWKCGVALRKWACHIMWLWVIASRVGCTLTPKVDLFFVCFVVSNLVAVMLVIYVTHSGTDILWQRNLTFALARINNTVLYVLVWDADILWRKAGLREDTRVISLSIHRVSVANLRKHAEI